MRILYTQENLAELLRVDIKTVKTWTRLGILPSLDGYSPKRYLKAEIDTWIASGKLEKFRPTVGYTHRKGVWG